VQKNKKLLVFIGGAMDGYSHALKSVYEKVTKQLAGSPIDTKYFYWTGETRLPKGPIGETQIAKQIISHGADEVAIVGHSYGGDTAHKVCELLSWTTSKKIKLLVTLDPVSTKAFIPFYTISKPANVGYWLNVWTDDSGGFNNNIAEVGGRWDKQPNANYNYLSKKTDHGDAHAFFYNQPVKSLLLTKLKATV